jgi:hypothetical protein
MVIALALSGCDSGDGDPPTRDPIDLATRDGSTADAAIDLNPDAGVEPRDLGRSDASPPRDAATDPGGSVDAGGPLRSDAGPRVDASVPFEIASGTIYANEFQYLWLVDAAASGATLVTAITWPADHFGEELLDIAFAPDGRLFGSSYDGLYVVDPRSGVATFVGPNDATCNGLTWVGAADGFMFCTSYITGNSYTVDLASGAVALLGDTDPTYKSSGDTVYVPALGTTYLTMTIDSSGLDRFASINTTSGRASASAATSSQVWGLAYRESAIIGFTSRGDLLTIAADGSFSSRGTVPARFAGASTRP